MTVGWLDAGVAALVFGAIVGTAYVCDGIGYGHGKSAAIAEVTPTVGLALQTAFQNGYRKGYLVGVQDASEPRVPASLRRVRP